MVAPNRIARPTADTGTPEPTADSALWMVSRARCLNAWVVALQRHRRALDQGQGDERLQFARRELAMARGEFRAMIRHGKRDLPLLAKLLAEHVLR